MGKKRVLPEHVCAIGASRTLYFVKRVPTDIQNSPLGASVFGGKKVWKRSLGSSDWKVARANYHKLETEFDLLTAQAMAASNSRARSLKSAPRVREAEPSDQKWISDRVYRDILAPHRERHGRAFRSWDSARTHLAAQDAAYSDATDWGARWDALSTFEGNEDEIDDQVAIYAEWLGLDVSGDEGLSMLRRAVVDGRRRAYAKLKGSDILAPLDDEDFEAEDLEPPKRKTLRDVLSEYEGAGSHDPKWLATLAVNVDEFEEFLGNPKPINRIKREDVQRYVEALQRCPTNRKQRFPNMTLREAIAANDALDNPHSRLSRTTIKDTKVAALTTLFGFALDQRAWISTNPTHRLKITKAASTSNPMRRLSGEELATLFKHPIWGGCDDLDRPYSSGSLQVDDHRRWAPLVLLYTGCRPKEVAALRVSDIDITSSTPHIRIRANEHGRLKTENAKREIPILDALSDAGFIEYVRRVASLGEERLFPGWELGGTHSSYTQAAWVRAFSRTVVPQQFSETAAEQIGLYSFRKCFKRLLATSGISTQVQDELMGHSRSQVEQAYLGRLGISETYKLVKHLAYPDFTAPAW